MNRVLSKLLACAGLVVSFLSPPAFGATVDTVTYWNGDLVNNSTKDNLTMTAGTGCSFSGGWATTTASSSTAYTGLVIDLSKDANAASNITVLVKYSGFEQGSAENNAILGILLEENKELLLGYKASDGIKIFSGVTSTASGTSQGSYKFTDGFPTEGALMMTIVGTATAYKGVFVYLAQKNDDGTYKPFNLLTYWNTSSDFTDATKFLSVRVGGSISKIGSYHRPKMVIEGVAINYGISNRIMFPDDSWSQTTSGYVKKSAKVFLANTSLSALSNALFTAYANGGSMDIKDAVAAGYSPTYTVSSAGVLTSMTRRFCAADKDYLKSMLVTFSQNGNDVYYKAESVGYVSGRTTDPETVTSWSGHSISESATGTGYAFHDVTVALPYDGFATWTGNAKDNDPANDTNWASGDNPYSSGTLTGNVLLSADADWSAETLPTLKPNGHIVNLSGHTLSVSSIDGSGRIFDSTTDTTKPGSFIFNVKEGDTWENTGVALSGNLRLVKNGAGTFVGKVTNQSYTGGTVINAGSAMPKLRSSGTSDENKNFFFGPQGNPITVNAGGTFKTQGQVQFSLHPITLNGGTIGNDDLNSPDGHPSVGNVTMTVDSSVDNSKQMFIWNYQNSTEADTEIKLSGHTLTKKGSGKLALKRAVITGGGKIVAEDGEFNIGGNGFTCDPDLVIELNKGDASYMWVQSDCSVPTIVGDGNIAASSGSLTVTNLFSGLINIGKPNGDYPFSSGTLTLAGGATLDLTKNTDVYEQHSKLRFAEGTITVDISGRTGEGGDIKSGDKVISWSAKPNAKFKWDAETEKTGVRASAGTDGLYYGSDPTSRDVAVAHWTNALRDGDIANTANWACTNLAGYVVTDALPGEDTVVYLRGDVLIAVPASTPVTWGGICLTGTLKYDFDLSGVTSMRFSDGATFDLNGHTVTVGPISSESSSVKITDSKLGTENPGELVLASGTSKLFGGFATDLGLRVRIAGGATLDTNGQYGTLFKAILADGATLTNTGTARGGDYVQIAGGLELEAGATATIANSSEMAIAATEHGACSIALNGGTLIVNNTANFTPVNATIAGPGTLRGTGTKQINIGYYTTTFTDDAMFELSGDGWMWMADPHTTPNMTTIPNIVGNGSVNCKSYPVTVSRRFAGTLTIDTINAGLTFASGMTLDLSGNTGTYAITNSKINIPENATIKIDLAGRTDLTAGMKIVSWTTTLSDTVRFSVSGAPYIVERRDNGLYLVFAEGLVIGVR